MMNKSIAMDSLDNMNSITIFHALKKLNLN